MGKKQDDEPLNLRDLEGYRDFRYTDPKPERDYFKYYPEDYGRGCLLKVIIFIGLAFLGLGLGSVLGNKSENKTEIENTVKKWKLKNVQKSIHLYDAQRTR